MFGGKPLAAALHRLIEKKASPEEKAKIHLALLGPDMLL